MLVCYACFDNVLSTDHIEMYLKRGKKYLILEIMGSNSAHHLAVRKS